jgi:hypothetical protein
VPLEACQMAPERPQLLLCGVFVNLSPPQTGRRADRATQRFLELQKLRCYKGE